MDRQKDGQKDRWKDGQTLFYRTPKAEARGPTKCLSASAISTPYDFSINLVMNDTII